MVIIMLFAKWEANYLATLIYIMSGKELADHLQP